MGNGHIIITRSLLNLKESQLKRFCTPFRCLVENLRSYSRTITLLNVQTPEDQTYGLKLGYLYCVNFTEPVSESKDFSISFIDLFVLTSLVQLHTMIIVNLSCKLQIANACTSEKSTTLVAMSDW